MRRPAPDGGVAARPGVLAAAALWLLCLVMAAVPLAAVGAAAGPAPASERWLAHDETSALRIDHGAWERFLLTYLRPGADGVHRLAYGAVDRRDRRRLDHYLERMSEVDLAGYRRAEQLAYWINLYNALTVDLVLDHYPIASIRGIGGTGQGGEAGQGQAGNAWRRPLIEIDGVALSLDDIENHVIEPIWNDPRVYYATTCPALGCPNLQPVPFTGDLLDRQLSDAAMAYVNDSRCIDIRDDQLHVSSFYRWHLKAFGGSDHAVIRHLMAYAEPDLAMTLQRFDRLHGDLFDWRLNDVTE